MKGWSALVRWPAVRRLKAVAAAASTRRWARKLLVALALFGAFGFLVVPPLVHHALERKLAQALARPVKIGTLGFNPYALTLTLKRVQIGEAGASEVGADDFLDCDELALSASWSMLWHWAPVLDALDVQGLRLHLVREAPQRFNFSDLLAGAARPAAPNARPLRLAVSNIRLENGQIVFDDRVLGAHHLVDRIQLGIPYITNGPAAAKVYVRPRLSARIDGSPFELGGKTQPFAASRSSDLKVQVTDLVLPPLMDYAPLPLPVELKSGVLSADLDLRYAVESGRPSVLLSGTLDLTGLDLAERDGAPLFSAQTLHLATARAEPLNGIFKLSVLILVRPQVELARARDGRFNFQRLLPAPKAVPSAAPQAAASSVPLDLQVQHFAWLDGSVHFRDAAAATPAEFSVTPINVALDKLSTRQDRPAPYRFEVQLASGGKLSGSGQLNLYRRRFDAQLALDGLAADAFQPYFAQALAARLTQGTVSARLALSGDAAAATPALQLGPGTLTLANLRLLPERGQQPLLQLAHAEAQIERIDTAAHSAVLPQLALDDLEVNAERSADGTLDWARLAKSSRAAAAAPRDPAAPWHWRIGRIELDRGAFGLHDRATSPEARLRLSSVKLELEDLSEDLARPAPLSLSAVFQRRGTIALEGKLAPVPLSGALHFEARRLDLAALAPYFAARLNATLASALLGAKGRIEFARRGADWIARGSGGLWLTEVRMLDKATSDYFAGWQRLTLAPLKFDYAGTGGALDVERVRFEDFYARIFLDRNGRLNLRNFTAQPQQPAASLTRVEQNVPSGAPPEGAPRQAEPGAAPPAPENSAPSSAQSAFKLHCGGVEFSGGKVDYTDDYIQPNFSADLTGIEGQIGAFGTEGGAPATVDVQAQLNDNGPVVITGTIDPLARPAALDLRANSHDIELTRFTTYAAKYAGYPILKGKLNVDLHYQLDHDRLSADNHLFIDQLTFGDHVDSPSATHLPVLLAVALLKNSRGEIDVDVPVHGSLSDPQFSLGGLILHAFLNLLEKAATSPFRLLGAAFGGGADLGYVEFAPGSSALDPPAQDKLARLAQALADRPALRLDLIGRVDPALDAPALKQARLEREIKRQKVKASVGQGESVDLDTVTVTPEEYDQYLGRVYAATDLKDKPRNFLGFAKALPPDQMKRLLLDHMTITDADLARLATARATAVQQWFAGKIEASRIYVVAPKLNAKDIKDQGQTTRVDFALK